MFLLQAPALNHPIFSRRQDVRMACICTDSNATGFLSACFIRKQSCIECCQNISWVELWFGIFSSSVNTSEMFGPNSAGVNYNILITNIPLGSLLYGHLVALVYEANLGKLNQVLVSDGSKVCIGSHCYTKDIYVVTVTLKTFM